MAHRRRGTSGPPGDEPEEQPPAPSDLLQMWISGHAGESTEEVQDSAPEPEPADQAPAADAADRETPPPESPGAWWPSDDPDESPGEPAADLSQWWPYAGGAGDDSAEEHAAPPSSDQPEDVDTAADESEWQVDTESEWTHTDGDATGHETTRVWEPTTPAAVVPPPAGELRDRDVVTDRARGWASFGTAPTAADVLEGADVQGSWSEPIGPPELTPAETGGTFVPDPTVDETAREVPLGSAPPDPAGQPDDPSTSSTAPWTLDDFEGYVASRSDNELPEWIGEKAAEEPADVGVDPLSRVRGLLGRMGLTREQDTQEPPADSVTSLSQPTTDAVESVESVVTAEPLADDQPRTDEPEAEAEPAEQPDDAGVADVQDHQDWYDDAGLRWTSEDGGYTWFSEDGQGWNAELGEPIEVPVVAPPVAPPVAAVVPPVAAEASVADEPETLQEPVATEPADPEPAATPDEAAPTAPAAEPTAYEPPVPEATAVPASEAAQPDEKSPAPVAASIPQHVEYKPRTARRPVLGVLFGAAAVLVVAAIFWAVTKGSQAATGIAVGITGFALAFWWGLFSWTPTVVSVNGSLLEVERASDKEQFDLLSPDLGIDVDDDTTSRNWRTTITRSNGTELVIPASAVDPAEFSAIVRHYREAAARSATDSTDS